MDVRKGYPNVVKLFDIQISVILHVSPVTELGHNRQHN